MLETPAQAETATALPSTASSPVTGSSGAAATSSPASTSGTDDPYRPSAHNQLTLVTSASSVPWNTSRAVVVVARLQGIPYTPTPQESLSPSQEGNGGDSGAWADLVLALLALGLVLVGAVALYRRSTLRSAYLLTAAPLLACTVLVAESLSRLMPAWL
jgi:sortase A